MNKVAGSSLLSVQLEPLREQTRRCSGHNPTNMAKQLLWLLCWLMKLGESR